MESAGLFEVEPIDGCEDGAHGAVRVVGLRDIGGSFHGGGGDQEGHVGVVRRGDDGVANGEAAAYEQQIEGRCACQRY